MTKKEEIKIIRELIRKVFKEHFKPARKVKKARAKK